MRHTLRFFVVFTLCIGLAAASHAFWDIGSSQYTNAHWQTDTSWRALFKLANRTDYTYKLTARQYGRVLASGEFTLRRRGNTLYYTLTSGHSKEEGDVSYDAQALAGAVLLSAIDPTQSFSEAEQHMVMTPVMFIRWYSQFEQADFGNYFVWEQGARPTVRFVAERHGWGADAVYYGSLQQDWRTVLTLRIDLREPLPLYIAFEKDGRRYEAQLVTDKTSAPILR